LTHVGERATSNSCTDYKNWGYTAGEGD